MLFKRIIPCLDVRDGRVVKGVNFRNLAEVGDPAELAKRYEREGADEVVFLDITATLEGRRALLESVERTAGELFIPLTVGGGLRTYQDVKTMLRAGADKASLNSAALADPDLIARCAFEFGSQCVVVAIDSKREAEGDRVYTRAGQMPTGRDTRAWAREACERGAGEILLTSIDRDGTREGFDLDLTRRVVEAVPVPVIASGGCGAVEHLAQALTTGGADAALAASIFHIDGMPVGEVKRRLRESGVPLR